MPDWEYGIPRLAEEIGELKEAVREEIREDREYRHHPPRRPNLGDIDDPNKGGWLPRNYNRKYVNQRQDIPMNSLCPVYEDGLYELTISAATKIQDGSATTSFLPTINANLVGAGSTSFSVSINLTSASSSGSTISVDVQLLAGSSLNLYATGSNLTVGQYNLFVSVLKLA